MGFGWIVYSSFKKTYNAVIGVGGLFIAILLYIFAFPNDTDLRLYIGLTVLLITLLFVMLLTFIDAAYELYKTGPNVFPKIRAGMNPFTGSSAAFACIADPSQLFHHGNWVSFYRVAEHDIEVPIGIGVVENVQPDGRILVEMRQVFKGHEDFARKVRENNADALASARIKPYIPQQMFGPGEEQV